MTIIVTSEILWGSRKNLFRKFWQGGRGRENHFREIGQKYPIFKGIYFVNILILFCRKFHENSKNVIEIHSDVTFMII